MPSLSGDSEPSRVARHREYEVHVCSRAGPALLRSTQWGHRVQAAQSVVRVRASASGLADFLSCCLESGLVIERMTRLDNTRDSSDDQQRS